MKQELRIVSKNLKETEVQYNILLLEKDEIQDKFARDLLEVSKEKEGGKEEITQLMVRRLTTIGYIYIYIYMCNLSLIAYFYIPTMIK